MFTGRPTLDRDSHSVKVGRERPRQKSLSRGWATDRVGRPPGTLALQDQLLVLLLDAPSSRLRAPADRATVTDLVDTVEDGRPPWQQRRRQQIVRAALELLEDGEYDKIQVRDVAQRSGFALGTIYRYFNSKEHLYAAVMLEWSKSFRANLRRQPLHGDPPDRLKEIVRRVLRAYQRRRQFLRLEIVLETSVDGDALAIFQRVGDMNLAGFHEALPGVDARSADLIILAVTSVLQSLLYQYALGRVAPEYVYQQVSGIIDIMFSRSPPAWDLGETSAEPNTSPSRHRNSRLSTQT
jgi:TetR/AcrR family transcriptional regulator, cholesterol catabolism regulator